MIDEQQFENAKKAIADDLSKKVAPNGQLIAQNDLEWVKSFMVTDEDDDEEEPLIKINGVDVGSLGNHSLVLGKKKSRKTFFLVLLMKDYPGDIENEILWFDTEQGKKHCRKVKERVKDLTGKSLSIFFLRGQKRQDKQKIITTALKAWPSKIKLVVVDGIRDLVSNINNEDETSRLIDWIENITVSYKIHMINVIHMNKHDNESRGHVGTELQNKAQTVIEIEKDRNNAGLSEVRCGASRDEPFNGFLFGHDQNGLPYVFNGQKVKGKGIVDESEIKSKLRNVFEGEQLKRKDLIRGIRVHFGVGETKAESFINDWVFDKHWIMKNGKDRSPNTVYKQNFV